MVAPALGPTPGLDEAVGWLIPMTGCTDAWSVDIKIPVGACLCGGLSADAETRSKMPWKTRSGELRALTRETSDTSIPGNEQAGDALLETRFRRDSYGHLCITGNMIRTLLQETGRSIYADDNGWYTLRRALRFNLRIEPTLIPVVRRGAKITEPDAILEMPRTVRTPPFERSVIQRPEAIKGPIELSFLLAAARVGTGTVLNAEVLEYMLEHAGSYIGLGSHRGVDETFAGRPGVFEVVDFSPVDLTSILGTATARALPPPLIVAPRKKAASKKVAEDDE